MNPPAADDDVLGGYLGAELLDAALADRFWFVVRVPGWAELSRATTGRRWLRALTGRGRTTLGWLAELVDGRRRLAIGDEAALTDLVVSYVVTVTELLRQGGHPLSPRRARVLVRSIAAVSTPPSCPGPAARPEGRGRAHPAQRPAAVGRPDTAVAGAGDRRPRPGLGGHRRRARSGQRAVLEEPDPVRRIRLGARRSASTSRRSLDSSRRRSAVATLRRPSPRPGHRCLTQALGEHALTPAAWSSVADLAGQGAAARRTHVTQEAPGRRLEAWRKASARLADTAPTAALTRHRTRRAVRLRTRAARRRRLDELVASGSATGPSSSG